MKDFVVEYVFKKKKYSVTISAVNEKAAEEQTVLRKEVGFIVDIKEKEIA